MSIVRQRRRGSTKIAVVLLVDRPKITKLAVAFLAHPTFIEEVPEDPPTPDRADVFGAPPLVWMIHAGEGDLLPVGRARRYPAFKSGRLDDSGDGDSVCHVATPWVEKRSGRSPGIL